MVIRDRTSTAGGSARILLLSYHFPPGTSAGALRWQKMLRFGAELGWECDVVTLHPGDVSQPDGARLDDLPTCTRVVGVRKAIHPMDRVEHFLWRLYRRLRSPRVPRTRDTPHATGEAAGHHASLPTSKASYSRTELEAERWGLRRAHAAYMARIECARDLAWARAAARAGSLLATERPYAAIISCGPPHMIHVAASELARRTGVPHVVDMRDPWSLVERLAAVFASLSWYRVAEKYEGVVVSRAGLIVTNTTAHEHALRAIYPQAAGHITTVMNGFDEDVSLEPGHGDRFVIAYAGTVYLDRDPTILFRAAATVIRELSLTPDEISIELMGHVHTHDGVSTEAIAAAEGLDGFLRIHPPRSHADMLRFLAGSAMVVSLPQDSEMAVPSKIFDYMQVPSRILALAREVSATGQLLRNSEALVVAPDDLHGVAQAIRDEFQKFRQGLRPARLGADARFSRREQAARLFHRLEMITGSSPAVFQS
jgi:hypothetical protein